MFRIIQGYLREDADGHPAACEALDRAIAELMPDPTPGWEIRIAKGGGGQTFEEVVPPPKAKRTRRR